MVDQASFSCVERVLITGGNKNMSDSYLLRLDSGQEYLIEKECNFIIQVGK